GPPARILDLRGRTTHDLEVVEATAHDECPPAQSVARSSSDSRDSLDSAIPLARRSLRRSASARGEARSRKHPIRRVWQFGPGISLARLDFGGNSARDGREPARSELAHPAAARIIGRAALDLGPHESVEKDHRD